MSSKSRDLELRISYFLRYGVIAAGFLMLIGWILHLNTGTHPFAEFSVYRERPLFSTLAAALAQNDISTLLAYSGLFCLISLPLIRVLLTALLFINEQDFIMAAFSGFVFCALILSFALGMHVG